MLFLYMLALCYLHFLPSIQLKVIAPSQMSVIISRIYTTFQTIRKSSFHNYRITNLFFFFLVNFMTYLFSILIPILNWTNARDELDIQYWFAPYHQRYDVHYFDMLSIKHCFVNIPNFGGSSKYYFPNKYLKDNFGIG